MELVINSRGAHVCKVDERFNVSIGGVKQEFSSKKIEKILITTSATITTDALKLAIENNIDVVFLEYNGKPFARVWHSKLGSITTIRRKQLKLMDLPMGTALVKEWIIQKLNNQISHLNKLKLNRTEEKVTYINQGIEKIDSHRKEIELLDNVPINRIRGTIEGHEGFSARVYFETLGKLIPDKYTFRGRSKNPAMDQFNCMLNYAYGILYSRVESACIIAGLDPYIGVLHTDNYNKTALVFDIIEMYRAYMDEIVFSLFTKRKVRKDMFDEIKGGGFWLNKSGKQLLVEAVNNSFENKIKYKGRTIKLGNIIQFDCHNIANRILSEVA
jgi:CRISPR-associated protein Cas1